MATSYPGAQDTFTNPTGTDSLDSPDHAAQHADNNDATEALEAKLGTTASTPAANKLLRGTGAGTSEWDLDFKDEDDMASDSATAVPSQQSVKAYVDANGGSGMNNLLKNGNFINNSTNGYGGTPDDWTDDGNANPVQGGFPSMTKAELIALLGIADGDIEGLWNLDGDFNDLSSNGYDLTSAGTPTDDDDGLMAQSKELDGSTEYAYNAAANCNITGSQTWICFFKPDTLKEHCLLGLRASGGGNFRSLIVNSSNKPYFHISGLTTSEDVISDVVLEADKWYMLVGVYDSSNTKLKIWVNGIKKEATASGSGGAVSSNFTLGRLGDQTSTTYYTDGRFQNAMMLSVALTDSQVKKLWAATSYKGLKIRRATTNGYMYQDLPEDLVERLRGKDIAIVAKMYQDTASTGQVSVYDGTTETASSTSATTGSWLEAGATATMASDADQIQLRLKHSTSDGNTWFKEVAFYEGSTLVYVWYPSYDDVQRLKRIMDMDNPDFNKGYRVENSLGFKAGALTTSELPKSGMVGYDETNNRMYLNQNGTVKYVAMS